MRKWIAVAAMMLAPAVGSAQAWTKAPDGSWIYHTNYATSVQFACGLASNIFGTCEVSGNQLTLGNNGAFMTLGFTGVSGDLHVTGPAASVPIGTLTKSFSGTGPFNFPGVRSENQTVFAITYVITSTDPLPAVGSVTQRYRFVPGEPVVHNCCAGGRDWTVLPLAPPPPGAGYGFILYSDFTTPVLSNNQGAYAISASVAIIPEPSTYALTAVGLAALAVVSRRRQRA